ncbi:crossover junction endodeoxyribonuclease RuvC [Thermaurantimonas aggregans]|uniref:Crossover junction endodeoxyribonuclease RuvC n=1 Tax=Thermaurantimonas aggregans TaxID=2173829 RepID=A0A401XME7_9FLAO|nr:crossover junction endodeoxyribonuclease RuvC [Thermaurantimonas aggregans]GCD78171.1 crossover junction endodeoxyribonuclease RuvC [Thermaurantimonas aggregans]
MELKKKIILGVDPGTQVLGYAIAEQLGSKITVTSCDIVRLRSEADALQRLKIIFEKILDIIDSYTPTELAIEAPFYGENVQSMHKLGRAQGVVIAAALYRGLSVAEYSPRKIKQSITGRGSATKEQVAALLAAQYTLPTTAATLDATDALAVAITHIYQQQTLPSSRGGNSWEAFIRSNPDRIR